MAHVTNIEVDSDSVTYRVVFDEKYLAWLSIEIEDHDVSVFLWDIKEEKEIFHSSEHSNYIDGIENKLAALNQELENLGLESFPTDVNYIYGEMYKACPEARPKIKDLGMTDEEYLAYLAADCLDYYQ